MNENKRLICYWSDGYCILTFKTGKEISIDKVGLQSAKRIMRLANNYDVKEPLVIKSRVRISMSKDQIVLTVREKVD